MKKINVARALLDVRFAKELMIVGYVMINIIKEQIINVGHAMFHLIIFNYVIQKISQLCAKMDMQLLVMLVF